MGRDRAATTGRQRQRQRALTVDEKQENEIRAYLGINNLDHLGEALRVVMDTQRASGAHLVNELSKRHGVKVGYNKAFKLIEALELIGAISPPEPNGTRAVLWQNAEKGSGTDE